MSDADETTTPPPSIAQRIEAAPGDPITITLRSPIKIGNRTVTELTVRPVKAKYMRAIKDSDSQLTSTLTMACKLTGEIPEVIDELSGPDLRDVLEAVNGFFFAIQGTGNR